MHQQIILMQMQIQMMVHVITATLTQLLDMFFLEHLVEQLSNANTYLMPTGSESWAGFANEDASAYPFTFGDGGSITFTGSTDGASADIYFKFEKNPYPDTEPSYATEVVTLGAESSEYTVDVPSQEGNTFSSFLLYLSTPDVVVTLNNVTVNTSEYAGPVDVVGCMDSNASNYNADANVQGFDQYGNLQCIYASCDDIPEYGCIYVMLRSLQ